MANTFKFGNGNWAVKDGYALAYNDENNNFKPLPFDFTRASSATTLNRQGLIETVGSGKPRIDFTDNTDGHLLLEPSRANYSIYSQDTSTWTYTEFGSGSAGTITTGKTDMFGGTNAVQVDFPANAENVSVRFGHTSSSISSGTVSLTLYIKLVSSGSKNLQLRASTSDIINVNSTEFVRYEVSGTKSSAEALQLKLRPSDGTSSGGFSIIVCHPQEEVGSYATSYIPTEGSSVTRAVETTNATLNSSVLSNLEGTILIDVDYVSTSDVVVLASPHDGSTNKRVEIWANGSVINGFIGGSVNIAIGNTTISNGRNKIALAYKSGDSAFYVNGSQIGVSSISFTISSLTKFSFNSFSSASTAFQNVNQAKIYNTRLSNTELQNLTS